MQENALLLMLKTLREKEEVILYNNLLEIPQQHIQEALEFLANEYDKETLDYPWQAPPFDSSAAQWSMNIIYFATQLILYREHKNKDLDRLFFPFQNKIAAKSVLSADICLRFIPQIIDQLDLIDTEDPLKKILQDILHIWHYSGLEYTSLDSENLDFSVITSNPCLLQLYIDRVIKFKNKSVACHSTIIHHIKSSLGLYHQDFWKDLEI